MTVPEPMPTPLHGYVGFDTMTKQVELKMMHRGFQFNVMVVGQTGMGKSTMINTCLLYTSDAADDLTTV